MIRQLKTRMYRSLQQFLHARDLTIVSRKLPWVSPDFAYRMIQQCQVTTVLDIGANAGQFASELRASGYAGRIVSFEPQSEAFRQLVEASRHDPLWECHQLGLGSEPGRLTMHISAFSPSSSMLPIGKRHVELFPFTAEAGTEEVEVVRLDDWLSTRGQLTAGLFLKIDTQGYETPVLQGASHALSAAVGVQVELNFAELFDGQSRYYDVMATLDRTGLKLFSLLGLSLAPEHQGYLWGDGLFLRPEAAALLNRVSL